MQSSHGMRRWAWYAACWAAALALLVCGQWSAPVRAAPAAAITVTGNRAVMQSQRVVFSLQATSTAEIDEVTLIYGYTGHGCNDDDHRQLVPITPGKQISARWVKDYAPDGPLTGMELWWQFELHDRAGTKTVTERQSLLLMDARYAWKTLEEGSIQLFWHEGGQPFGELLMDLASTSLRRLAEEAGVKSTGKIRIVIYPSPESMRFALGGVQEWAGGVALGEYDLILAAISPGHDVEWAKEVIPHELTHLITEHGFVDCNWVRLPRWLVEGIAEYTEGPIPWGDQQTIRKNLEADTLPALKTLRHSFPMDGEAAHQAYTQSAMVVGYLIETHGAAKLNSLVEHIRAGQTIDQAMREIYGLNTEELDQTWRAEMGFGKAPAPNFITETPLPTRTAIPTLNLRSSVWNPNATATPTLTATAAPTLPAATATEARPPTRTPIPAARGTNTPPAAPRPAQPPADPWLLLGGGMAAAVALVGGLGFLALRRAR